MKGKVIKVSVKIHKRLLAEKMLMDASSIDEAIANVLKESRNRKKKSKLYNMMEL